VPLAKRIGPIFTVASVLAAIWTGTSEKELLAFDKQECVAAYESAQQLRNDLKMRRAREQLLVCGHSSCPAVVTKDCISWLTQVDESLASVVFRVRDERGQLLTDVRILMDGELLRDKIDTSAVMVDPGLHVFRFESRGLAPGEQKQMLPKGERNRPIDVRLKPQAEEAITRPEGTPGEVPNDEHRPLARDASQSAATSGPGVGTYVAGGVGLVALSSFAYFGLTGNRDASNLRSECAPNCSDQQVSAARSKLIVANVSLGVGIAAFGVGAILWAVQSSSSPSKGGTSKGGAAASGFRFGDLALDVRPAASGSGAEVTTTLIVP